MEGRPVSTGKTILAYSSAQNRILVIVQRDRAAAGQRYGVIRDKLVAAGVDHAVFLDGSDSSLLLVSGTWIVSPGQNKNESIVVGVGFM